LRKENLVINGLGLGIGDIIVLEPLLRELKKHFNVYLILPKHRNYSDIIECFKVLNKIDEVITITLKPVEIQIRELQSLNLRVDYLYHPYPSHYTIPSVTKALTPQINMGFHKRNSYLQKHREYLDIAIEFEYIYQGLLNLKVLTGLDLPLPENKIPLINFSFKKFEITRNTLSCFKDAIIVQPFTSLREKDYPTEVLKVIIKKIRFEFGKKVIVVGSSDEKELLKKTFEDTADYVVAGDLTFCQVSSLLRYASLLIVQDSSLMHSAYVQNLNFVALFGATDFRLNLPANFHDRVIRNEVPCAPCYKESGYDMLLNCKDKKCFATNIDEVLEYVRKSLYIHLRSR
jgi:ADP-heptose:LPS heptosyltransferase